MRMKKITYILGFLAVASLANATLDWSYTGTTLGAGYSDGWLVSMYKDVNVDTTLSNLVIYTDGTLSSTDDTVAFETSVQSDGANRYYESLGLVTPGLFTAYTVVFNATNFAAATQYIIVDATKKTIGDASGINTVDYSLTSNSGTWKNIQAVPEPTTLLLFAIGGIGSWIVRRKQTIRM
jgi:hypothetical protein